MGREQKICSTRRLTQQQNGYSISSVTVTLGWMCDAEQNTDVIDGFYEGLDRELKRRKRAKTYFE